MTDKTNPEANSYSSAIRSGVHYRWYETSRLSMNHKVHGSRRPSWLGKKMGRLGSA